MDLRIDVLRRFVVLAEELNITRAAARLHLTQQGLSAQLKQLEAAVGVELLSRSTQRVELTPAGAAFRDHALAVIAEADAAVRAAKEAAGRAELLLACQIDAQWLLAEHLDDLRAAAPDVEVVVVYMPDMSALEAFAPARIDAAVLWDEPPPGIADDSVTLAVEEVLGLVPEDDELADGGALEVPALAGRTVWMWPREAGAQVWDRFAAHVRTRPESIGLVGSAGAGEPAQELMIGAVQEKGGYTMAPASYLRRTSPPGLVALPFDPPLRVPLVLAWRGTPGRALQRLLRRLPR